MNAYSPTIPEDRQYHLTPNKRYLLHLVDNEVLIIDDEGDTIPIKPKGCHFLDGGDWRMEV